ncbi:hypothetical protein [Pleionea sp. CnH1-48]|uniref:hypothetical protein n=1 Tax=Pleionea sp. CnH1-48 TaxID=2954494 RepID=UPI0020980CDD|nr:hypothetical protein [Pleionea sp. CnH1-48]MCO7225562.1 hypothetical protein [Pleionea sp. CnH1-48]
MKLYTESEWCRIGTTKEYELSVDESKLTAYLKVNLPKEFSPYALIASYFQRDLVYGGYTNVRQEIPLSKLKEFIDNGVSQFFIQSKTLTPKINLRTLPQSNETLLLNGLICLQVYRKFRGLTSRPTILMVDAIRNTEVGGRFKHNHYQEIYWSLQKEYIRKKPQAAERKAA